MPDAIGINCDIIYKSNNSINAMQNTTDQYFVFLVEVHKSVVTELPKQIAFKKFFAIVITHIQSRGKMRGVHFVQGKRMENFITKI